MKSMWKEASYVPRYVFVGLITLGVDTAVFKYSLTKLGEERHLIALSIAVACAYVVNFLGHKLITFSVLTNARLQLTLHLPMKLCVYAVRLAIMYVFVEQLGYGIYVSYATGLCLGLVTFLGSRWIFTGSNPLELLLTIRLAFVIVKERIKVRLQR